jgi:hypothetical protein
VVSPFGRVCIWALPLVGLGCLLVVAADAQRHEHIGIGYILGTMFGQTTLAAAWTALGPLKLIWRLPLSMAWLALLVTAMTVNFGGNGPEEFILVVAACLLGQWMLVQLPLWGLALGYRLRLRHGSQAHLPVDRREGQFGIRQLMIFTAIVAVIFGVGRLVAANLSLQFNQGAAEGVPIFIFLAVAAILVTLPLVLAMLLPRFGAISVALLLGLVALATAWELPLLSTIHSGPGPDTMHLVWINGFTAAWIIAFMAALRLSGYRLIASGVAETAHGAGYPGPCP